MSRRYRAAHGFVASPLAGCAAAAEPFRDVTDSVPVSRVDPETEFSPLLSGPQGASPNDRCPVRRSRLIPKMPPAFVNGRPVGFC